MESKFDPAATLELIPRPAFCVSGGLITHMNPAAAACGLITGAAIEPMLFLGREEYAALEAGCLYLTLELEGIRCSAVVTRQGREDLFVLDQGSDSALQALSLAAKVLREPLGGIIAITDRLELDGAGEAALNQRLHQLLRIVCNMSDAARYSQQTIPRLELTDVCALLREIFEKAAALAREAGITLRYRGPDRSVICPVDQEKLERAVYNLISNAMTFTPQGGTVEAQLTHSGSRLMLSVTDRGQGMDPAVHAGVFTRYLRQPGLEDSRYGIGLGMLLVQQAAAAHGGTVLVAPLPQQGTRVSMTLSTQPSAATDLRSGLLRIDYAGGKDHALIELSPNLPASSYRKE